MKVCVTGGSGFIGSYFCARLAAQGDAFTILDLVDPPRDFGQSLFVKGDVRDPAAVRQAMSGCDSVIHLAAAHHDFGIADDTYFDVNERGSQIICDVMDELAVRQIVFYSTVAMYGNAPEPLHEETEPQPNSPYGASKLAGERVFRAWTEQGDGRQCLVIRPTVTFGRHNFANMYSLIRQINSGRFFFVGRGGNIKSLSFVENILDATFFLMQQPELPPFDVYNYVEKPDMTSREIATTVYEALGKTPPRWSIPMWLALLMALPFDLVIALTGRNLPVSSDRVKKLFRTQTKFESDKIRRLGFEPRYTLKQGIEQMVQWYQESGHAEDAEWHQPPAEAVLLADAAT